MTEHSLSLRLMSQPFESLQQHSTKDKKDEIFTHLAYTGKVCFIDAKFKKNV